MYNPDVSDITKKMAMLEVQMEIVRNVLSRLSHERSVLTTYYLNYEQLSKSCVCPICGGTSISDRVEINSRLKVIGAMYDDLLDRNDKIRKTHDAMQRILVERVSSLH